MPTESRKAIVTAEHKEEAAKLRRIWDATSFDKRGSQADFGAKYQIGSQSAVGFFLNGQSALSLKAARGFARGLGVSIAEFSPRLAKEFETPYPAGASAAPALAEEALQTELFGTGVSIAVLAAGASMGPGVEQHDDVVIGRLTLSPQWISKTLKPLTKPDNLRFIHGYGDSMEPTFYDGDILLVDAGVEQIKVDGIYVLQANDRLYIKRVRQRMDASFEISSDNATVKTVDVLDGSKPVSVLGRVIWTWNGKKL